MCILGMWNWCVFLVCVLRACRCVCTWWVYFGVLWLLNLVYMFARFGILAAWIWGTWCTLWSPLDILRSFNLVYFLAVLGGFSIYLLPGDLVYLVGVLGVCTLFVYLVCVLGVCTLFVYLVGVLGDLVAGVWYTCSSSLFTSIAKFALDLV